MKVDKKENTPGLVFSIADAENLHSSDTLRPTAAVQPLPKTNKCAHIYLLPIADS